MSHLRSLPVLFGSAVLLLAHSAAAVTRTVPTQFPTIQAALNASPAGDTVAVLPGTYVENLQIGLAIVLRSTGGPAVTVIDGSHPADPSAASTVKILAGKITGFDIRNGTGTFPFPDEWRGGGVYAEGSVTVQGNWIHNNVVSGVRGAGGGVYAFGNVIIRENRIYGNRVEPTLSGMGGGLYKSNLSGTPHGLVEANEIFGNHVENGSAAAYGFGVFRHNIVACNSVESSNFGTAASGVVWGASTVEGNTIVANWSFDQDQLAPALRIYAIECVPPCPVEVFGNLIAFNFGHGIECRHPDPFGDAHFACNDIYSNFGGQAFTGECANPMGQDNNISVDPQFGRTDCPYEHGSWCLGPDSPLLPENSPLGCGLIGAVGECSQIGIADSPPPSPIRGGPAVPNPFTERTTIPFYLAKESAVEVMIVDVLGRQIRRIEPGRMTVGDHSAQWDGRTTDGVRAASGAYIAIIRAGGVEVTETLLLLR
jgi:hypothetical protein